MVTMCLKGEGTINFNEVRYSYVNNSQYIYNIPSGRILVEDGYMIFSYAWLYVMSRKYEIPIRHITSCKLIEADEAENHPFYKQSPKIPCYKTSHKMLELRYSEGIRSIRVTIKMRKFNRLQLLGIIDAYKDSCQLEIDLD